MTKTVVVKAKGGMGNRMLCAVTGLLWGELAGRDVYVDWRDGVYAKPGETAFSLLFDAGGAMDSPPDDTDDVYPMIWSGRLDKSMSEMLHELDPNKHSSLLVHKKYSLDPHCIDYNATVTVFWYYLDRLDALQKRVRTTLPGYKGLSKLEILARAFNEYMPLSPDIRSKVGRICEHDWSDSMIGVHIRHTDMRSDVGALERGVRSALERRPEAKIFVATDNADVEGRFRSSFGDRVVTLQKQFAGADVALHHVREDSDQHRSAIDALLDMYLLASCDALVYSGRSTFSFLSRCLSGIPNEDVIDTDRFNLIVRSKKVIRRLFA